MSRPSGVAGETAICFCPVLFVGFGNPAVTIQQMAPLEHTSDKQAYYSFIDPGRMKG